MPSPDVTPRAAPNVTDLSSDLRRDMIVWAEPVIADLLGDAYDEQQLGTAFRSLLAIHHRRMWRALILERRDIAEQTRRQLLRDMARAGIAAERVGEIDNEVLEELLEIVLQRFRSSRDAARGCSRVLLAAASSIGATRPVAA